MIPEQQQSVIIVAGGKGKRAGGSVPKQFQPINKKPMLMHTIEAFYKADYRMRIIVVLPEGFTEYWKNLCDIHNFSLPHSLVVGGETRFHSVKNGLALVSDEETVGIHDAARPFISETLIKKCFDTSFSHHCGVIPVVSEKNTVRFITENSSEIIDRNRIKLVQTPQVFPAYELKKAYDVPYHERFTDDASVAENSGMEIKLVEGEEINIKITTPFDLKLADFLLSQRISF